MVLDTILSEEEAYLDYAVEFYLSIESLPQSGELKMTKSISSHQSIVSFFFFKFFFFFPDKNRGWELCLGWMKLKFEGIHC